MVVFYLQPNSGYFRKYEYNYSSHVSLLSQGQELYYTYVMLVVYQSNERS